MIARLGFGALGVLQRMVLGSFFMCQSAAFVELRMGIELWEVFVDACMYGCYYVLVLCGLIIVACMDELCSINDRFR